MAIFIGYPYADDELYGGKGNDSLYGDTGNDTLTGNKGNDTLTGGADSDTFVFANNDGKDLITDYAEEDIIKFTSGTPKFKKSGSNVLITLGNGTITVKGAADKVISYIDKDGNELTYPSIVSASGTTLKLLGNYNKDYFDVADYDGDDGATYKTIDASAVENELTIIGNKLANKIIGTEEDDSISGGAGKDTILGGDGNDTINGGKGNDSLSGGEGTNTFLYNTGDGDDIITDYKNGDIIYLASGTVKNAVVTKANDYVLTIGSGKITIKDAAEKYIHVVDANGNETWYPEPPTQHIIAKKSIVLSENFFDDSMNVNTYTEAAHFKKTIVTIDASAVQHDMNLVGNSNANIIIATDQDDVIDGAGGKDTILAGGGNDSLNGGTGNDSLIGGKGNDTLTGGSGADIFVYNKGDGNDFITDYNNDDMIVINNDTVSKITKGKVNVVFTLASKKNITIKGGADKIISYSDAKYPDGYTYPEIDVDPVDYNAKGTAATLNATYSKETFIPKDYSSYSKLASIDASAVTHELTITGNAYANRIVGTDEDDAISGAGGKDSIYGGDGNDTINGGAGNDILTGGKGNDTLTGGAGADTFIYNKGDGNDFIADYNNDDTIVINNDTVTNIKKGKANVVFTLASKKNITIKGGADKIISYSDAQNPDGTTYPELDPVVYNAKGTAATLNVTYLEDSYGPSEYSDYSDLASINATAVTHELTITGNKLANYILGTDENDYISGAAGKDKLYGNDGNDTLVGGAGNDILYGGAGNDSLWGGTGTDTLYGDEGNDTFVYQSGDGNVTIADFARGDKIRAILSYNDKVSGTSSRNGDVTFNFDSGGQLTIKDGDGKVIQLVDGSGNPVQNGSYY